MESSFPLGSLHLHKWDFNKEKKSKIQVEKFNVKMMKSLYVADSIIMISHSPNAKHLWCLFVYILC